MVPRSGRRPDSTPYSLAESVGVVSVAQSDIRRHFDPSAVAEEVAEDMTAAILDGLLGAPLSQIPDDSDRCTDTCGDATAHTAQNEQLKAELASARSEIEFAQLKEEELEKRHQHEFETIENLRREVGSLERQLGRTNDDLQDANRKLAEAAAENDGLHESLRQRDLLYSPRQSAEGASATERPPDGDSQRLPPRLSEMEPSTAQPTMEFTGDGSEETPLLAAAYQQISVLNTQLAHLYTELTMARTEVQNLKAEQPNPGNGSEPQDASAAIAEVQRQSQQQVADLVSDIRHLQLDLEYHQHKLDQMIEEKQLMMKDLKKAQKELSETKQQVEARDQMLKHREVDLEHLRQEVQQSPRAQGGGEADSGMLAALRTEAAAKDSALIVSHYELHKEKLMRDRLEQKNLKLMERMQKLMMVVETMRKENITLERTLAAKDKQCEDAHLKVRQLGKLASASRGAQKGGGQKAPGSLELETPSKMSLPPVDRLQRSGELASGRQSGYSTPRTPRPPQSPYTSR